MCPEQQLHVGRRTGCSSWCKAVWWLWFFAEKSRSSLDGGDRHLIRLFLALPPLQQPLAISLSSLWRLQQREEEKDWEMRCRWGQLGEEWEMRKKSLGEKRSNRWNKERVTQKNKRGKLDNDNSNNSLDLPGDLILEASSLSLSLSDAHSLIWSHCPPSSLSIIPPAAVSLLINFSLLTKAQSCSFPLLAWETALRSALSLPHSCSSSYLHSEFSTLQISESRPTVWHCHKQQTCAHISFHCTSY